MTRIREDRSEIWTTDPDGKRAHDPHTMSWGPQTACPVSVAVVTTDPAVPFPHVEVTHRSVHGDSTEDTVSLNPGAARWLGNRLIEAALMAEQAILAEGGVGA